MSDKNYEFQYHEISDVWGEPQIYKGVNIYPVKVEYMPYFLYATRCLKLRKDRETDFKYWKMTNLQYLISKCEESDMKRDFFSVLNFVFNGDENIVVDFDMSNPCIFVGDARFYWRDFDEIRKIILKQSSEPFDENLSLDMQEAIDRKERVDRKNGKIPATINELIVSYHTAIGASYSDIKKLTIYQFRKGLERKGLEINYNFTPHYKDIKSWLDTSQVDNPYSNLFMSEADANKLKGVGKTN